MGKFIVNGGKPLNGTLRIQGAKNAVLPIFAAAMLTDEAVTIHNCPNLCDVENMSKILETLGAGVRREGESVRICAEKLVSHEIPCRLARELRSSIFLLGSVLGRGKRAKVAYPGGCDIGLRPIDIHLKALAELHVGIVEKFGYISCDATHMRAGDVSLDYPSVGATENIMLLAATAKGVTTISNAAREPEIVDLQEFMNACGAKIKGAGTPFIIIEGVERLHGTDYTVMPDRIVAGTYLIAGAICGGSLTLKGTNSAHISALLTKLSKSGCKIAVEGDTIKQEAIGRMTACDSIDTQPYPGFPTDLQAQMMALACVADGTTIITENIFETRYKHVPELIKMGAQIKVKDRVAVVKGVAHLSGAEVTAMDLRGGAGLVLAALCAQGQSVVHDVHHIERGYDAMEKCFGALGADMIKIKEG